MDTRIRGCLSFFCIAIVAWYLQSKSNLPLQPRLIELCLIGLLTPTWSTREGAVQWERRFQRFKYSNLLMVLVSFLFGAVWVATTALLSYAPFPLFEFMVVSCLILPHAKAHAIRTGHRIGDKIVERRETARL